MEEEPDASPKEEGSSSDDDFGFKKAPATPIKTEEAAPKRKAAVKGSAKPKQVSRGSGQKAPARNIDAGTQKTTEAAEQILTALKAVAPLQVWASNHKQEKDLEAKVSKALKLVTALEGGSDCSEASESLVSELKAVSNQVSSWATMLSSVKQHAGTEVFELPEELVDELVTLPARDLTTILTDVGSGLIEAVLFPWFQAC